MPIITIEHKLTDEEINERAKELAEQVIERASLLASKADAVREYNNDIKVVDKAINHLSRAIESGHEDKNVDCIIEKDFETKEIRYLDSITNEVVKVVPLSPADQQLSMQEDIENAENPEADIDEMEAGADEDASESDDDLAAEPSDEFSAATAAVGL